MQRVETKLPEPPSDDNRWKLLQGKMRKLGIGRSALIETLHNVQNIFGFLDEDALRFVADTLHVPLSRVYGVATFYHFFNLKPQGEHTCVVCTGTACHIKGADKLIDKVDDVANVEPDETSEDGKVSLLTARCIGACGLAPAVVMDGEVVGKVDQEKMGEMVEGWLNNE